MGFGNHVEVVAGKKGSQHHCDKDEGHWQYTEIGNKQSQSPQGSHGQYNYTAHVADRFEMFCHGPGNSWYYKAEHGNCRPD